LECVDERERERKKERDKLERGFFCQREGQLELCKKTELINSQSYWKVLKESISGLSSDIFLLFIPSSSSLHKTFPQPET